MIPIPPAAAAFTARQGVQTAWRIAKIAVPALVIAGLAVALLLTRSTLDLRTNQRDALQLWQNGVVVAITAETVPADAQGRRPPIDPATVETRIHGLGADILNLRNEIARQNEAITRARNEGEQRLQDAQRARQEAERRNAPREATRRALEQPSRSTGLTAAEWSQL